MAYSTLACAPTVIYALTQRQLFCIPHRVDDRGSYLCTNHLANLEGSKPKASASGVDQHRLDQIVSPRRNNATCLR